MSLTVDKNAPPVSPALIIAIGILAVSTASLFIRFAQAEVPSLAIASYRLSIAALVLAPIALNKYRTELKSLSKKSVGFGIVSGIFLAFHFATWITSLEYTSIASSVVIVTTTPLWVALFSPFTIKEKISKLTIIGLIVALTGTLVIAISDLCMVNNYQILCPPLSSLISGRAFIGDILALIGAWTAAGYVLIGRNLRNQLSLIPYIFIVYGIAAIALIGISLINRVPLFGFTPQNYLWLILLALIPQLIGHSSFNWALGYLPASFVSITLIGEPIGSIILGFFILNEIPMPLNLIGAAAILIGIIIAAQKDKKLSKE